MAPMGGIRVTTGRDCSLVVVEKADFYAPFLQPNWMRKRIGYTPLNTTLPKVVPAPARLWSRKGHSHSQSVLSTAR